MKKLIFAVFAMAAMMVACGNKTTSNNSSVDSTDSVDTTYTLDSLIVC